MGRAISESLCKSLVGGQLRIFAIFCPWEICVWCGCSIWGSNFSRNEHRRRRDGGVACVWPPMHKCGFQFSVAVAIGLRCRSWCGVEARWKIECYCCFASSWRTVDVRQDSDPTAPWIATILYNLEPFTKYAVYVQTYSITTAKVGAMSQIKYFTTKPGSMYMLFNLERFFTLE